MASQTIGSTTGKGAGEVRLSHVLVRVPAGARHRNESGKAPAVANGQGVVEMGAGEVSSFNYSSQPQPTYIASSRSSPHTAHNL